MTSPRVRVAYEFADSGFTVAGAWGKAFKLPSLYALGHPLVGNPDLVPERGESYEFELSQQLGWTARRAGAPRSSTASSAMPSTSIPARRPCW